MNETEKKSYSIFLKPKDKLNNTLPYGIANLRVSAYGESLTDACEKAEVYFSGALGVSLVTESAYEETLYENDGGIGNDIEIEVEP
jgi:hypothetical protein